ncbi:GAF domain-containing protein [Bernardetia sp.]|uniref:GAF domain-containing protein n=1 Tax=Bernardetia sp. TaxID=1937974 RepID=UPI0025B8F7BC|nr:GAF domain-containing protein [Bernardetia sp.]
MGQKLYSYYVEAGKTGGVKARTELSILTKISSAQAKSLPDESQYLKIVEDAWKSIQSDSKVVSKSSLALGIDETKEESVSDETTTNLLRNHITIFSDFVAQRSLYKNDIKKSIQRITEVLVDAIQVERASIWFYIQEDGQEGIECIDLYERSKKKHSEGVKLYQKDFPNYFEAIKTENTIAAHDAHTHRATKEFSEVYLKPLGIESMLDVPIWKNGKMIGVVCHEHTNYKRTWTKDEENFAYLIGHLTGMILEYNDKH